MPAAFKTYVKDLTVLNLACNRLKAVEKEVVASMGNLTELNLSYNQLTRFPYEEYQLPKLKILDITGNPLEELPRFLVNSQLDKFYFDWGLSATRLETFSAEGISQVLINEKFEVSRADLLKAFEK